MGILGCYRFRVYSLREGYTQLKPSRVQITKMFPLLAYLNFPHEKLFFLIYRELCPLCLTYLHVNRIIVSISISHGSLEN